MRADACSVARHSRRARARLVTEADTALTMRRGQAAVRQSAACSRRRLPAGARRTRAQPVPPGDTFAHQTRVTLHTVVHAAMSPGLVSGDADTDSGVRMTTHAVDVTPDGLQVRCARLFRSLTVSVNAPAERRAGCATVSVQCGRGKGCHFETRLGAHSPRLVVLCCTSPSRGEMCCAPRTVGCLACARRSPRETLWRRKKRALSCHRVSARPFRGV